MSQSDSSRAQNAQTPVRTRRGVIAWLAALLAFVLAVGGVATPAFAADGAVIRVTGASSHNGTPVYTLGNTYELSIIAYRDAHAGKTLTVDVPADVELDIRAISASPLVASATVAAGQLVITLVDTAGFAENVSVQLGATFTMSRGELCVDGCAPGSPKAQERDLTWTITDGTTKSSAGGKSIVTVDRPDLFPGVTPGNPTAGKNAQWNNQWMTWFEVDGDGTVVLKQPNGQALADQIFTYSVTYTTADAGPVTITDTLGTGLQFTGTPTAMLKTWDALGVSATQTAGEVPAGIAGTSSFDFTTTLPARSTYTLTYQAKLAPGQLDALIADLQKKADAAAEGTQRVTVDLTNAAVVGGKTVGASVGVGVALPQPVVFDPNRAFAKSARSIDHDAAIIVADDGSLVKAGSTASTRVRYTLTADLTDFGGEQDVIVRDPAPAGATWDTVTLSAPAGTTLTRVASEAATRATALTYTVTADGTLFVNVGRDAKKYAIEADALLSSVPLPGVRGDESSTTYTTPNTATFEYRNGDPATRSASTKITSWGDLDSVITNRSLFDKKAPSGTLKLTAGESTIATYTFVVNGTVTAPFAAVPLADVTIRDAADPAYFDLSESALETLRAGIRGNVGWGAASLAADDFDVTQGADGIDIRISASGLAKIPSWATSGRLEMTVPMTLKPVGQNQDITVKNDAVLLIDGEPTYEMWSTKEASSWVRTATIDKDVYDPATGTFTKSLRVAFDEETGKLATDEFTYRVRVLPKEGYTGNILVAYDELPSGVEFLGFAWTPDLSSEFATFNPLNMGEGIQATWEEANNRVAIQSRPGEFMGGHNAATVYLRVKVTDYTADTPIINTINGTRGTIVPSNDYPLTIAKYDPANPDTVISDTNARFALYANAGDTEALEEKITVVGGVLVHTDGTAVKVAEPGTYWVQETTAPSGYELNATRYAVTVDASGITVDEAGKPTQVKIPNAQSPEVPAPLTYAIGDIVWVDANADGLQGDDEFLEGVTVSLLDAAGNPVAGVAPVQTDENGRYWFDELPAGDYRVMFALTADQAKIYTFTVRDVPGAAANADSDADPETGITGVISLGAGNTQLVAASLYEYNAVADIQATQGIDPTWDAGVVLKPVVPAPKTYAIGDIVWVDTHESVDPARHGNQGENEFLADVVVNLERQVDGAWTPVDTTTTDAAGRYLFDELEEGIYRVQFVLTEAQAAVYEFTTPRAPLATAATDSNAGVDGYSGPIVLNGQNAALTTTYDAQKFSATEGIDPTWDAGVVRRMGNIAIEKLVVGLTELDSVEGDFVFAWTAEAPEGVELTAAQKAGTVRVAAGEIATISPVLPLGTVVTFTGESAVSAPGYTSTLRFVDGASQIVAPGEPALVTAENAYAKIPPAPVVSVGDYVWIDENKDGRQDETDVPLEGVVLTITGPDGKPVQDADGKPRWTTTDATGFYVFDQLPVLKDGESYTVAIDKTDPVNVTVLAGLVPTTSHNGGTGTDDSSTWSAASQLALTVDKAHDPTLDFGFIRPSVSVGDYVWVDTDRDGLQGDPAVEPGIPGVKLELIGPDGGPVTDVFGKPVRPVVTGDKGQYSFDDLPLLRDGETYTVRIVRDDPDTITALAPYVPTTPGADNGAGDKDSSTGESTTVAPLDKDEDRDPTLDFGFVLKTYALGDFTWIDETDRDGIQGARERVLPGVTVTLLDGAGLPAKDVFGQEVAPQMTDADGRYLFDQLPAGRYEIVFALSEEQQVVYTFTQQGVGDDATDSDADPTTGSTGAITLGEASPLQSEEEYNAQTGQERVIAATQGIDPTWDAGVIRKKVSVGDYVWIDANGNGLQDATDVPIAGVKLALYGPDGTPFVPAGSLEPYTTVTDENGFYAFTDLPAIRADESYTVKIVRDDPATVAALEGLVPTRQGTDNGTGDKDSSTWSAVSQRPLTTDAAHDPTLDFGFVKVVTPPTELPLTPPVIGLPATGGGLPLGALFGGILLVGLGAWALVRGRAHARP